MKDVKGVLPLKSLEDVFIVALKGRTFAVVIHCFCQFVVERWTLHSNGLMALKKANFSVVLVLGFLFVLVLNPFFSGEHCISPNCAESESDCFQLFLCGIHLCSLTVTEEVTDFFIMLLLVQIDI